MKIELKSSEVVFDMPNDTKLPVLSFAIQIGLEYMLGCGVWRLEMARYKLDNMSRLVYRALVPARALTVSSASHLRSMFYDEKLLPLTIPKVDLWQNEDKLAPDGSSRIHQHRQETVISMPDIKTDISLGYLCFGLSDQIVGQFFKGATTCRIQVSQKVLQCWYNRGYSLQGLEEHIREEKDYDEESTVGSLP